MFHAHSFLSFYRMSNRFVLLTILLFGVGLAGRDFYKILGVDKYTVDDER